MKFSKSELDIIYQYAAPTKAETLAGMKEIVPVIKDLLTKAIVENAIRKLEKIPEPECSQFVAATKPGSLQNVTTPSASGLRRQSYRSRLCRGMTCQERNGSIRKPGT